MKYIYGASVDQEVFLSISRVLSASWTESVVTRDNHENKMARQTRLSPSLWKGKLQVLYMVPHLNVILPLHHTSINSEGLRWIGEGKAGTSGRAQTRTLGKLSFIVSPFPVTVF